MEFKNNHLIIPMQDSKQGFVRVYVPQPNAIEMQQISRVLGYFYKNRGDDFNVVVVDYQRLVEESLQGLPKERAERLGKEVFMFLEKCKDSSLVVDENYCEIVKGYKKEALELFDKDFWELFKGTLLFFSALFRYSLKEILKMKELKEFHTSLGYMEWVDSCKQQLTEQQEPATPLTVANNRGVEIPSDLKT